MHCAQPVQTEDCFCVRKLISVFAKTGSAQQNPFVGSVEHCSLKIFAPLPWNTVSERKSERNNEKIKR
jgi:hypothetical protein